MILNQVRQDVVIDFRDLTPEERKRFLDLQAEILEARKVESNAAAAHHALLDARAAEDWAKRAAICREQEELKLAEEKAEAARQQIHHDYVMEREREWQRPSHTRYVEVVYDEERKQFVATHCGVTAYGNSPEMACDNFDHLWLYGEAPLT